MVPQLQPRRSRKRLFILTFLKSCSVYPRKDWGNTGGLTDAILMDLLSKSCAEGIRHWQQVQSRLAKALNSTATGATIDINALKKQLI